MFYYQSIYIKGGFTIFDKILKRIDELEGEITRVEKQLCDLPAGNFVCCTSQGRSKWFTKDGDKKKYIPKANRTLAEMLAYRKYLEAYLKELMIEYEASKKYFSKCSKIKPSSELLKSSEIRMLTSKFFTPLTKELQDWMNVSYETNTHHMENLIHKSSSGRLLRSKSEAIIDMCLYNSKIPNRYECKLVLGDKIIFPDFIARRPQNGKEVYWEHFGMMDDPKYANKACDKVKLYVDNGIIPSINLITTYETKDNPLTAEKVMRIINEYLL